MAAAEALAGHPVIGPFLARLAAAPVRVLMLDYDGTLAPFQVQRDAAGPYPGVREELRALLAQGATRVVVVSGRAAAEAARLLGVGPGLGPEVWGSHGWERLSPDGRLEAPEPPPGLRQALAGARRWALDQGWEARLETKPVGLAFHLRGLPAAEAGREEAAVRQAWAGLAAAGGLDLHAFDGGLELRPAGKHKGHAVHQVLSEAGPRAVAAYLGDDLTDEDAFQALDGRGLALLVRAAPRPTAAQALLRPPGDLLAFLAAWRAACERR